MGPMNPALRALLATSLLAAQAGCDLEPPDPAGPLAPENRDYAGVWEQQIGVPGDEEYGYVIARISPDGWMAYKKLTVSGSGRYCTAYNSASIQDIKPDAIETETIFGFNVEFSVEQPPRERGGEWTMTLDGDRLVRTRPAPAASPERLDCDELGDDEDRKRKHTFSSRRSA